MWLMPNDRHRSATGVANCRPPGDIGAFGDRIDPVKPCLEVLSGPAAYGDWIAVTEEPGIGMGRVDFAEDAQFRFTGSIGTSRSHANVSHGRRLRLIAQPSGGCGLDNLGPGQRPGRCCASW